MMVKLRRGFAIVLAVLVLFSILASFFWIIHETDHDCLGEDCPICSALAVCWKTLNQFSKLFLVIAVCSVLIKRVLFLVSSFSRFESKITPVSLNVKLLN